jgi:hypothetical protein
VRLSASERDGIVELGVSDDGVGEPIRREAGSSGCAIASRPWAAGCT